MIRTRWDALAGCRPWVGWTWQHGLLTYVILPLAWNAIALGGSRPAQAEPTGREQVRLALVDGSVVTGTLVRRSPLGYRIIVSFREVMYRYDQVIQELDDDFPRPPPPRPQAPQARQAAERPAESKPSAARAPAEPAPAVPVKKPANAATKGVPAAPKAPRRDLPPLDDMPGVPSRALATVGWFMFGLGGAGFTVSVLNRGDQALTSATGSITAAGLLIAVVGISRRTAALDRLNRWRRDHGLPELDGPDEVSWAEPTGPVQRWAVTPVLGQSGEVGLGLAGTF